MWEHNTILLIFIYIQNYGSYTYASDRSNKRG